MDERDLNFGTIRPGPKFFDVEDRLARAREVQDQLASEIRAFSPQSTRTRTQLDPGSGMANLMLAATPAPRRWSLLASDATHQLRSALDNLLFLLADGATMGEKRQKDLTFPIVLDDVRFPDRAKTLRSLGLSEDLVEAVREVQPCFGETDVARSLALVHETNRIDKHRYRTAVSISLSERAELDSVDVRSIDLVTSARRVIPLNAGAVISVDGMSVEIPIASVIVEPPDARVELSYPGKLNLRFNVEFGQRLRFSALDLIAATDDVEGVCRDLWSRFGS